MITQPLAGRRVLVTRTEEDSTRWAARLAGLGATPVVFPCIVCEFMDDAETVAVLRAALSNSSWLVLTSARGAEAVRRLLGGPPDAHVHVAAVGPATARASADYVVRSEERRVGKECRL